MAYNNGFPMNYGYQQPYFRGYEQQPAQQYQQYQSQQIPQQSYQPVPIVPTQQQVPQQQVQAIRAEWVQGEAGARSYDRLRPNEKIFLFDSENSCFYVKILDAEGKPLPLKVYEYQERPEYTVPQTPEQPAIDMSAYATKAEIEQMINAEVEKRISEIQITAPTVKSSKKEK